MKAYYLLILVVILAAPVSAKEGFILRWSYIGDKPFSSVSPFDGNRSMFMDHILAGSLDNRVYLFSPEGVVLGYYEATSSITSVGTFVHDGDLALNDGIAGSLDDRVYAFWKPSGDEYFKSAPHWWNASLGDNVYAVGNFDYNENGQFEGVVAGIGNYADKPYGMVYAFSDNGTLLWTYATSSSVRLLSHADLDSDNILSDVVVGAGNTVHILNKKGSLIWSYSFNDEVKALSYADFDLDGEKDDILVGAGNVTYALNSHKELLWKHNFNSPIAGITPVDVDKDDIIDYYLVSAGTRMYALKNSPKKTEILWNYDLGHKIDAHTGVDFDNDGVMNDIAVISGNVLYAYDFEYLYLPDLRVFKAASVENLSVGDNITIDLKFENKGKGIVKDVYFKDALPDGFELVSGNLSISGVVISALEDSKISYTVKAIRAGEYVLPPVEVHYTDGYGKSYVTMSNSLNISVSESKIEVNETPVGTPKLIIKRILSSSEISQGGNVTVLITLINSGNAPALTVNFEEKIPERLNLVEGDAAWMGVLEPGERKDLHYTLQLEDTPGKELQIELPELVVYYRDSSGKIYESKDEAQTIKVIAASSNVKAVIPILGILVVAVLAYLYRRGLKSKKIDPSLEERFIQVYLRYQREGKRPTYQEMRDELGVGLKEVEILVKRVKKRLGITPFSFIFSKIKSLKK